MSSKKVTRSVAAIGVMMAALFVVAACVPKTPPASTTTTSTTESTTTSTTASTTTTSTTVPTGDAPVAVISTQQPTSGAAPLINRFSIAGSVYDTSDPQNCLVDFGTGFQVPCADAYFAQNRAVHTFRERQTYTITLTVKGTNGETATDSIEITPSGVTPQLQVTPNPIPVTSGQNVAEVVVRYDQMPDQLSFVEVCKKSIANPTFDVTEDCAYLTRLTPNATPNGEQAVLLEVFRGDNPDGETPWGCYAPGDVAPAGFERFETCYVRTTVGSILNFTDDVEQAFTFTNA